MRLLFRLPAPLRLLLLTQFAFNVGFFLVVPFLAAYLGQTLHLAGWVVGAVLGLRTFSQQGLFFLGGALSDRFGVRRAILVGCVLRIAGFVVLGSAQALPAILVGVVLVGVAAALFSPATEGAIVAWGADVEAGGGPSVREIVAAEVVCAKLGSIVGPVVGALLVAVPFRVTCLVAAGLFGFILLTHLVWLPRDARAGASRAVGRSLRRVWADRPFLVFAALHSTYLVSYNQLYLAAPVELERIGAPAAAITWVFVGAAVVVAVAQMPVTSLTRAWGAARVLRWGYTSIAVGFAVVACCAPVAAADGPRAYVPLACFVVLLHVGGILVLPAARTVVARLAGGDGLGTYLGCLASAGGAAVLIGSTVAGRLLEAATAPRPEAVWAWLFLAALPAASALAVGPFCARFPTVGDAPTAAGRGDARNGARRR